MCQPPSQEWQCMSQAGFSWQQVCMFLHAGMLASSMQQYMRVKDHPAAMRALHQGASKQVTAGIIAVGSDGGHDTSPQR